MIQPGPWSPIRTRQHHRVRRRRRHRPRPRRRHGLRRRPRHRRPQRSTQRPPNRRPGPAPNRSTSTISAPPNEPRLDPAAAERAAGEFLERAGATGTVDVDGASVTVTVTTTAAMHILPTADRTIIVSETATAVDGAQP